MVTWPSKVKMGLSGPELSIRGRTVVFVPSCKGSEDGERRIGIPLKSPAEYRTGVGIAKHPRRGRPGTDGDIAGTRGGRRAVR
jgi:hypothetical protein